MTSAPMGQERVIEEVDGRIIWRVVDLPGERARSLRAGDEFTGRADDGPPGEFRWVFEFGYEARGGVRIRAHTSVDGEVVVSERIRPSQVRVVHRGSRGR